jgi:hypothetical protein
VPIDEMVAELGWPRVDFIKMDIEGAERHGLRGAGSVLARWKPRILIDMCRPADGSTVLPQVIRASNGGYPWLAKLANSALPDQPSTRGNGASSVLF